MWLVSLFELFINICREDNSWKFPFLFMRGFAFVSERQKGISCHFESGWCASHQPTSFSFSSHIYPLSREISTWDQITTNKMCMLRWKKWHYQEIANLNGLWNILGAKLNMFEEGYMKEVWSKLNYKTPSSFFLPA